MSAKYHLIRVFTLSVLFTFSSVFAGTNDNIKRESSSQKHKSFEEQDRELIIYKKSEKQLDVYTFTPKKQVDKDVIIAVENRLKVLNQGVVSFSRDDKNLVTLTVDPAVITKEGLEQSLSIVIKIHEYYSSECKIIEL